MAENSDNNISSPVDLLDTPTRKTSGKPKSIIWESHIKREKQISKGHWSATCNYCNKFWYKGSPATLEDHLGNLCNNVPSDVPAKALEVDTSKSKKRKLSNQAQLLDFIESTKLTPERIKDINRALVKAFVICKILFHIIENPFFIELLKTLRPGYEPPSKDILSGCYLAQETAFVNQAVIKKLNSSKNLTIASDGWSNPSNESIWNFVIYTPDRCQYLWYLRNLSNERHTQELLAEEISNILKKIGPEKFSAVVTDSGANIRAAHRSKLRILAEENLVEGGGLKLWVDTRWHTMYDCVFSIIRYKVPLEMIHNNDVVNVSVQSILRTRAFFDDLNALAFVLHPIKLAISTLESQDFSLADCFIDLVCLGAAIKRLPKNDHHNFRQQAIAIFNRRFAEEAFRHILLAADAYYEKMDKTPKERKMLMSQMRNYYYRIPPFDILFDDTHKLFSVTPHAAGCERIWSALGWYYGKHRTRLSLGKIENMQKLSAFYYANSKNELPYFSSNVENLHEALYNMNVYNDDDYNEEPINEERSINEEPINEEIEDISMPPEENMLQIEELLNLDATDFTDNLGEIIVDTNFELPDEENSVVRDDN
ncbi:23700_t:CDS:2, partial [Gigaspora margarita]